MIQLFLLLIYEDDAHTYKNSGIVINTTLYFKKGNYRGNV